MTSSNNNDDHQKWYSSVAKRIGKGIVQFLLPVIILVFLFEKASSVVQGIMLPLKPYLPTERIFGVGMFSLISLLFIVLVCYIAGMLSDRKRVKSFVSFIEDNLFVFIPGYAMIKSSADAGIDDTVDNWKVVMINEDDNLKYGIEVNRRPDGYSIIFIPEPPDAKSGEMKLMLESKFKRVDLPVNKLLKIIRNYANDATDIPGK